MLGQNNDKQVSAGQFIVSSWPWVTSSVANGIVSQSWTDARIANNATWLSSFVTVKAVSGSLAYAFTANGFKTSNYYPMSSGETISLPFSLKGIWISGSNSQYSIQAGLTHLNAAVFPDITQSNGFSGVG